MCEGSVEFVGSVDTAAVGYHHHLFATWTKDAHDLMGIPPEFLSLEMGHKFIEDTRGAILNGANDTQQDATRDAAPAAIGPPGLPFESFLVSDLARTQGTKGQAIAPATTPPSPTWQGKAPNHRLVFIEQDDLAQAGALVEDSSIEAGQGDFSGIGIEPPGGTAVAQRVFLTSHGWFRARPQHRFVGRARWRVHGNATANGHSHTSTIR